MDETHDCWTNQQSIVEFKNQWYLFYHHNDLSPHFDKNRSVRVDSLFFNEDGTIQKVIPTLRGVGITDASREIQIDRYSLKSDRGVSIAFLDTLKTFEGWKTVFDSANAWIQYNGIDFGNKKFKIVKVRALSTTGGTIELRLDTFDGPTIARVEIAKNNEWNTIAAHLSELKPGVHNLVVSLIGNRHVELDWLTFE